MGEQDQQELENELEHLAGRKLMAAYLAREDEIELVLARRKGEDWDILVTVPAGGFQRGSIDAPSMEATFGKFTKRLSLQSGRSPRGRPANEAKEPELLPSVARPLLARVGPRQTAATLSESGSPSAARRRDAEATPTRR